MVMNNEAHQKITTAHLSRMAYLYVRQSTLRQVLENTESTHRQYALRERAVALGWPFDRIIVIDSDLGQSGASAADREGFQRLVTEVSLGCVGIVLGLEVSRLARNSTDWHRLLELCAFADTLILDEDGLYNPAQFNDRLLLGLKGTMSEAELHVLKARLRGGILSSAVDRHEKARHCCRGSSSVELVVNACRSATTHTAIKAYQPTGAVGGRCIVAKTVCVKPYMAEHSMWQSVILWWRR
jgi:DNA invertase Pin-like site-specific DNA recombinase